jgi:hypothetical protein
VSLRATEKHQPVPKPTGAAVNKIAAPPAAAAGAVAAAAGMLTWEGVETWAGVEACDWASSKAANKQQHSTAQCTLYVACEKRGEAPSSSY